MKYILVNYNNDPTDILKYTDDFLIYDRSDDGKDWCKDLPKDRIIYTDNMGHCDYDKLSYLVDHYDNLPDIFLWSKTNMLSRHISIEEFEKIKDSKEFIPVLTQNHKTYLDARGVVCYYENGLYHERNDSWYLTEHPAKNFKSYHDFAKHFRLPSPDFIPFAPGGCYILTKERVRRYSRDFYDEMRGFMPYCETPGEAYLAERCYYTLWS